MEAGVSLNNEAENEVHQIGGFLGQLCDYKAGTVRMIQKPPNFE